MGTDQEFRTPLALCRGAQSKDVRLGSMLSKKDFWHRCEEEHFKNKPASGILIQVCLISDSIIAHFRRSDAHRLSFSTASVMNVGSSALSDFRSYLGRRHLHALQYRTKLGHKRTYYGTL
jgi:hypothetical protein